MKNRVQVVIVEDIETDAELVARRLAKTNLEYVFHRVQTEPHFQAALREIEPDLILSDFSLPQFDGLKALEIAARQAPDTPFIFVSGTIGEERAIEALRRGATDYVLKGNLSRLAAAVERALREAQLKIAQRRAEQQLRDNERRLRDTVETAQDWIWELDQHGCFRFCSGAVASILGYQPGELIGRDFRDYLHEDERPNAALLLPPPGQSGLTGAVARWRGTDGRVRWLERNVVTIVDELQRPTGYRGADRDITVRREQEARLQRLTRTYRMLSSTSSAILRLRDRGDFLEEVCRIAVQQGGYGRAVISLIDPGAKGLRPRAWAGADSRSLRALDRAALDAGLESAGIGARAVRSGAPAIHNDLSAAPTAPAHCEVLAHGYPAVAALPLFVDGTPVGAITLFSAQRGIFNDAEVAVLLELTANLGFALQYLEKHEAVQFLSYFDGMTGLAKRPLFCQRLARLMSADAVAGRSRLVVVFDVQQLGAINDSFGRYVGDRLLENIAARLKQGYPDGESVAYFGGGTFALTLPLDSGSCADTGRLLQNAAAQLFVEPFVIDEHQLRPAVRSGVALCPQDADSADALVQNAEAALKAAREDNERYMLYGFVTARPTTRSLALEARLAVALERREFLLHYQPKLDVSSGRMCGLEALLRWQDSQDGLVPPSLFVPLLERSGAIAEVGEWVLQQAVRDMQRWFAAGLGGIRVAVNVSPLQLRRRDFVDQVLRGVRGLVTAPQGVDIEITESMLMQDIELSMHKLAQLREAGIGVAIDDFGTGYSSLRLLARLPVDTLKIDRSFIQGVADTPNGITLVSTIVSLAHAFGMQAVAEGVETAAQLQSLRNIGCDQAQGYLFARPVPGDEIPVLVARLTGQTPGSGDGPAR
jgi:PAS domain S-box-containing protein/diguanylate cyclase (GGDEF)-like protein